MKFIIVTVLMVVSVNCQSPAFDSFMSRNRDSFNGVSSSAVSSSASQSLGQQSSQQLPQWQQLNGRSSFARSLNPSVSFASSSESVSPFVTSNSHNQAFNPAQQSAGSPTTISGPNFQTSITLPALPPLPQHPAGSPAALAHQQHHHHQHQNQQSQQQQQQFQPQPQLTHQFSTHVHNHQAPSSQQLANQPFQSPFFNPQGNNNFPFNFQSPQSAPLNLPTPPSTQPTAPQSFGSLGFSNNFFNNQQQFQPQPQQQQQQQSAPLPSSFNSLPSTTIRAPGFETTFVFMRPSEQPTQGSSLSKLVRDPSGIEKQMYFVPMPNYSPPSVYNTQIVHSNPQPQQQQQGQQL
ncbi:ras-interacting protein RIP3-like [Panonychus citri]|uniref:ras-interacting protein RIP3-like n=1 Tax=Panonychus citri TaxID=50023 RepID=UPI002307F58F|nr:ras-interacting protein RIP3-like [Panonychus citri]